MEQSALEPRLSSPRWDYVPPLGSALSLRLSSRNKEECRPSGTDIDVDAYEAKSLAIFRELARADGMNEQEMIDHLKLIPRQAVGIVRENPVVLKNYDPFWAALAGWGLMSHG